MPSQPSVLEALPLTGTPRAASTRATTSTIVRGPRKVLAAAGVWARIARLAFRTYRHPHHALRAVARLGADRWTTRPGAPARFWTSQKCVASSGRYFWNLYAPGFPSVAFDRAAERELTRGHAAERPTSPLAAIVAITRRCALTCEHCLAWDALNQPDTLSTADLHEIVRRLRQRGVAQLFFSGGEPLQRFADLLTLAESASRDTDVWLLTSGLGLTADKARRLAAAGVTGLALSLDHWNPSAHDRFRGLPGSFEAVERAAGHARAAGLLVALSLCPTRTFTTLENLGRYAEKARSLGASFIQILEPKAIGHYAGQDVTLEPLQQRMLEQFAERLNADASSRDLPSVHYVDWSARTFGCGGAGDRYLYVDTAGELHACPFCRTPGLRVLDDDLDGTLSILKAAGCPAAASCAGQDTRAHAITTRTCP